MSNKTEEKFDAIVIGAGQGGGPLAGAMARAGWSTAIIEKKHVGGTCVNVGCTPTKTIIASGRVAYLAKRAADYGVNTGNIRVDIAKVRERKRSIVESFRNGSRKGLEKNEGLELIFGEASFSGPKSVQVHTNDGNSRNLTAEKIFINTGGRPTQPRISGLDEVPILDNETIMELDVVPEHLFVIGGGYIGLEFGQLFRRLGSNVTIVQRGKQLLAREDDDVAEEVTNILEDDGIEVLLQTQAQKVEHSNGQIHLTVTGERKLTGSHLLIAAGRVPNTDQLNLNAAGVETDKRGFVNVNERLETTAPGIYAIGDVKGGPQFTHISYDDYRLLRTNLLEKGNATTKDRLVPYTVFIDPQLGRVGMSERQAREQGYNIRVAKIPMTYVARALEVDETRGLMKAIVHADTDQILGCAILSIEGGEVMSVIQVAMMGKLPYTAFRDGVFAHPTLAESLNTLFGRVDA
ncbi:mercuric reductase [candidate division KSB1 bacterium]|nr:mercuric reductase [candidate division KSB1 bacterium]NIR73238.1 mercuric reductase [candidate division KSB1 bacterium]NIS28352.1 mercuric reductase [candidate division KSB1 bacterium]NIT74996.1 mercuric reductase [candidate division KSB1 bacterium]NIU29085.1 mercuric reductase [candidate division KSB1 bacterium]